MRQHSPRTALLYGVFMLSGLAGLGYEIAWTRMFTIGLGHEMPSVLAVVAAFFGGLALGGWALDRAVSASPRPARWYAALEAAIGLWGLLSIIAIPAANDLALAIIGLEPSPLRHWLAAFTVPLMVLLPATMAMGATLPAIERLAAARLHSTRLVGGLYAINTLGAVAGVVVGTFVLMPAFGFRASVAIFSAINLGCAGMTALLLRDQAADSASEEGSGRPNSKTSSKTGAERSSRGGHHAAAGTAVPAAHPNRLAMTLFATGFLGVGYEVLGVRVMSQVTQGTIYSFAGALAVYLICTAVGASIYQRMAARRAPFAATLMLLSQALCVSCLLGILVLGDALDIHEWWRVRLGGGAPGSMAAEIVLALLVFGLPALLMGAMFSHLVQASRKPDGGIGRAAGLNTLGAAMAPALVGVAILPAIGAKAAIIGIAAGYLLLVPRLTRWSFPGFLVPVLMLPALPPQLRLAHPVAGGHVLDYREGVMASVAVVDDPAGARFLKVSNRFQMGGTSGTFVERRLALLPLMLHPNPRRALFLGVGTGITLNGAMADPNVHADGVELVPEVIDVLGAFEPENSAPLKNPRLAVHVADARRFVRVSPDRFDVIIGDLFHPARDGAGMLYTVEHFRAIRERLAPGGVFCQWIALYQLDDEMVRIIARTFLEAFPDGRAFIGHFNVDTPMLGLVGSVDPVAYSPTWYRQRVKENGLEEALNDVALGDEYRLFGCLIAGTRELADYARSAPVNTDDHPVVMFRAPWFAYVEAASTTYGRLQTLLDRFHPDAGELIDPQADDAAAAEVRRRLNAYLSARDMYLRGLIMQRQGQPEKAIEQFVECTRLSHDFGTGYAMGVHIAREEASTNPQAARALLKSLIQAQPREIGARQALWELFHE